MPTTIFGASQTGRVVKSAGSWNGVWAATSGDAVENGNQQVNCWKTGGSSYAVGNYFFTYDLTSLKPYYIITSAIFHLKATSAGVSQDGGHLAVTRVAKGTPLTLNVDDYELPQGAGLISGTQGFSGAGDLDFTINLSELPNLLQKFGSYYEIGIANTLWRDNIPPNFGSNAYSVDNASTLEITYQLPGAALLHALL